MTRLRIVNAIVVTAALAAAAPAHAQSIYNNAVSYTAWSGRAGTLGAKAVAVGDVNGDGVPDLVAVSPTQNSVAVLTGKGDGTFNAATLIPLTSGGGGVAVALADFDKNGHLDIAVAQAGGVVVLYQVVPGTFTALPMDIGTNPIALAIFDLNNDGWPDIATLNASSKVLNIGVARDNGLDFLVMNSTTASFSSTPSAMALADMDGNGVDDLLAATSELVLIAYRGATGFSNFRLVSANGFISIAAADVNGDGVRDIIGLQSGGVVKVLIWNAATAKFEAPSPSTFGSFTIGGQPGALLVDDVNDDGIPDVIVANTQVVTGSGSTVPGDSVSIYFGERVQNKGTQWQIPTTPSVTIGVGRQPSALILADVNGDTLPDIVTANLDPGATGQFEDLSLAIRQATPADLQRLLNRITSLQQQSAGLTAQIAALQGQVNADAGLIATLQGQRDSLQSQVDGLQSQIDTLTRDNGALQTVNTDLQQRNTQLESQLTAANGNNATLQSQLAAAIADKTTLQQQLATALADKATLQAQLAAANADKATLQQQLGAVNGQIAALQSQLVAASGQITSLQSQLDAASAANAALAADKTALQGQVASLTAQNTALAADKAGLQQSLAAANGTIASQAQQLAAANATVASQGQQLAANAATIAALNAAAAQDAASLAALQQLLRAAFQNPTFQIPGATTAAQIANIVNAIAALNHGQQQAVYTNLDGRK